MYAGVGIEQQRLAAAAAGSARCLLRLHPSPVALTSYAPRTERVGRESEDVHGVRLGFERTSKASCNGRRSIFNRTGIWSSRGLDRLRQHGRSCEEEWAPGPAHGGHLRSLSSMSRARRVSTALAATALSDGISTEERVAGALKDLILDGSRATSIAHKVWHGVVRPGDTVIDATCGNGLDTLMLARLVLQDGTAGYVIGLDLQQGALDNTSALLDRELSSSQRNKVSLLQLCHSQLDKVVDESSVRLVAFNLGYQPGGNKTVTTEADTTVKALGAAVNVLEQQGLISIMSYVGHPGGREEYDAVRKFVAGLPPKDWDVQPSRVGQHATLSSPHVFA